MLNLNLSINNKLKYKINAKELQSQAFLLLEKKGVTGQIELELSIVDNRSITLFNKKYMGKNNPTDVLSFPMQSKAEIKKNLSLRPIFLGEIVISYPVAKIQAAEKKISLDKEIGTLFLHGLKHLLGYHHK